MYLTLYNFAGIATLGWLLMVVLPTWKVTRRMAEWELFPVYLSALYLLGVVPLLVALGPGMIREFGSAEGVVRLLANPDVALIAWIHILAFDQVVGVWIYRENMRERYVPIVIQSVLLFLTLMFGPVGFLTYSILRAIVRGRRSMAGTASVSLESHGIEEERAAASPTPGAALRMLVATWAQQPGLFWMGVVGLLLGAAGMVYMAVRGPVIGVEGDLTKSIPFDIALGFYTMTIALFVPLADWSPAGRRRWVRWQVGMLVLAYGIENVQIARGLDPRFSHVGTPIDQLVGLFFFVLALGLIVTFALLAWGIFRRRTAGQNGVVLLAVRYACVATAVGFASGLWMSVHQGRHVGSEGNIIPLHAIGFHALQAIPLLALFLCWGGLSQPAARRTIHLVSLAWIASGVAIAWQTAVGRSVLEPSAATAAAACLLIACLMAIAWAARGWLTVDRVAPVVQARLPA